MSYNHATAHLGAEAGFPLPRPDRAETTPPGLGRFVVPHHQSFSALMNWAARTYRWQHDEALRHSPENTLAIRRDPVVMDALRTRQIACAQLGWHLDVEDNQDQALVEAAQGITDILKTMPRWQDFLRNLLEGVFYGRYGNQIAFGWNWQGGRKRLVVRDHRPINGDKLVFKYDGRAGILVHYHYPGTWEYTDRGRAHFFTPEERECLIVHRYEPEDADFYEPELGGSIHGKGIRDRLYWFWLLKNQVLGLLMDFLERVGAGGLLIYFYEAGNVENEAQVREIAERQDRNLAILFPRYRGEPDASGPGVQHIQPSNSGANLLAQLVTDYFDNTIRRYILGQSLTSEAHATGLGSGIADLHADTFARIVKYDATALAETITEELVSVLQKYNYSHALGKIWFCFDVDRPNAAELLEAAHLFLNMGGTIQEAEIRDLIGLAEPAPDEPILSKMGPMSPVAPGMGMPQGIPMMGPPGPPGMGPMAGGMPPPEPMPMSRRGSPMRYADGQGGTGRAPGSHRILPDYDQRMAAQQLNTSGLGEFVRHLANTHPHPTISMLAGRLAAGDLDTYYPLMDALAEFGQTNSDLAAHRNLQDMGGTIGHMGWSSSPADVLTEQVHRLIAAGETDDLEASGWRSEGHRRANTRQWIKGVVPTERAERGFLIPDLYEPPFRPASEDTWTADTRGPLQMARPVRYSDATGGPPSPGQPDMATGRVRVGPWQEGQ